jgi:hypothetical protein
MNWVDGARRLFYIRYPALCGLILFLLGPLAAWTNAKELLANTLLVHTFWQVLTLTVICLTAAKLQLVQVGVILFNGPARFLDLETPTHAPRQVVQESAWIRWDWSVPKTLIWFATGLTLPLTAVWYSVHNRAAPADVGAFMDNVDWATGLMGIVAGTFADFCLLLAFSAIERRLFAASTMIPGLLPIRFSFRVSQFRQLRMVERLFARAFAGNGYTTYDHGDVQFCPGHWQQIFLFALIVTAYLVLQSVTAGSTARPDPPLLPTLFFAVFGLIFASTILSGASFYLDYFHFPTLLVLTVALLASYSFSGRDHKFVARERSFGPVPPTLMEVVGSKDRQIPNDKSGKRTLVVITAPGGGIHAAAWTAQVLTGMHYRYGDEYARSLCLISAVSGGSVGTMYYAANFERLLNPASENALRDDCRAIVERAGASGLEAVGWGLIFLDLPSVLPFVDAVGDRGTTLDECWRARLSLPSAKPLTPMYLGDWRGPTLNGQMPIVVFNSTEVESGRRVLFSPVYSERRKSLSVRPNSRAAPVEFSSLYPTYDIDVATAARLSATFPYVSPTATPDDLDELGHMADGGYVDNEGIVTAVDWVSQLINHFAQPDSGRSPFDRVLILRIRHEVPKDPLVNANANQKTEANKGFEFAAFGPLKAVLTVRGTSQIERGQVEVDFIMDAPAKIANQNRGIEIQSTFLDFTLDNSDEPVPLSWKLSPREFAKYQKAWESLKAADVVKEIDQEFFVPKRP